MISDELLNRAYNDIVNNVSKEELTSDCEIDIILFNRVMAEIRDKSGIDEEDIRYFPESYNITSDEMITVFNYLYKIANINTIEPHVYKPECFNEIVYLFQYGNLKFAIRRLDGQGTSFQMYTTNEEGKYYEIKRPDKT